MEDSADDFNIFTSLITEMAEVFSCCRTRDVKFTLEKSECEICRKEIPSRLRTGNISNINLHEVINMTNVLKCLLIPVENFDLSLGKKFLQSKRVCEQCLHCLVDISVNLLLMKRIQKKLDTQRVSLGRNLILNSLGKTEEDFSLWESHLGIQAELDVKENNICNVSFSRDINLIKYKSYKSLFIFLLISFELVLPVFSGLSA